jgi:hypothetical protein
MAPRQGKNRTGGIGIIMKHYAIDQWADFTRGLLTSEARTQMQTHVQSGCSKCRQLSDFTTKLAATCSNYMTDDVPESTVRLARAIFPVRTYDRPKRGNRLPIELIFDSFLVPSPVGLRATWQVGWQGLYRAGDCSVDLRIEPELKSSRAAVIGQITNRFGEFQMEYDQQSQLKLCIDLRDAKSIQVPLKRFTSNQPAAKSRTSSPKRPAEKQ